MNLKEILGDAYKEGMTQEEIEQALEGYEPPTQDDTLTRYKKTIDKLISENADYKRKLKEKQTAEEAHAQEEAEKFAKLQEEHDALLKQVQIANTEKEYLALGYDSKLATDTANALVNGDMQKVFANQKKHLELVEQQIKADVLKATPRPAATNNVLPDISLKQFDNMTYRERVELKHNDPELYKQLVESGDNTKEN